MWRVRLGKLYYVQGYHKHFIDDLNNPNFFEYSNEVNFAWLFDYKDIAKHIAEICGGIVESVIVLPEEFINLYKLREEHTDKISLEWGIKGYVEHEQFNGENIET